MKRKGKGPGNSKVNLCRVYNVVMLHPLKQILIFQLKHFSPFADNL